MPVRDLNGGEENSQTCGHDTGFSGEAEAVNTDF